MTIRSSPIFSSGWMHLTRKRSLRAAIAMTVITACTATLTYRLADLQLVRGAYFQRQAEQNRARPIPITPDRGSLLDRRGRPLATSRLSRSVYLLPRRHPVETWAEVLTPLEPFLERPLDRLLAEIAKLQADGNRDLPIRIARDLSQEGFVALAERGGEGSGLFVRAESSRYYPHRTLASHVLGYIGEATPEDMAANPNFPMGAIVGRAGVERLADDRLRGRWGRDLVEVDAGGEMIRLLGRREAEAGQPVRLTLDLAVQRAAEAALGDRRGAVVAIDPRTGGVLALASYPGFDPNWFTGQISSDRWAALQAPGRPLLNRALQGYPPGSTFKMVTAVAGMQAGQFEPTSRLPTFAAINLGGHLFREHSGSYGVIGFRDAIAYSSNTFFYQVGLKAGPEAVSQWGKVLGIGDDVDLDLPGGTVGSIPTPADKERLYGQPWYGGDTVSMSIGQGLVLATPLELAVMASTFANGGQRVVPHLLADQTGTPEMQPRPSGIDPAVVQVVREGMVDVVRKGTARNLNDGSIPLSGGKTGTAEVPQGDSNAMFVGFAPADNPEIAVAVAVEHGGYGGQTAAPIAKAVYQAYFAGRGAGGPSP